jgi:hypothetical protein
MPRRTREDFDQDFLDAVAAAPDERTPQQIADTHIDRRQKLMAKKTQGLPVDVVEEGGPYKRSRSRKGVGVPIEDDAGVQIIHR